MKDSPKMWNSEELRRDLQTALGTTKWQVIISNSLYLSVHDFLFVRVCVGFRNGGLVADAIFNHN